MPASGTIEQAAAAILAGWRHPEAVPGPLPDALRPKNLTEAYGIQQAVSRALGPIGGWRICRAGTEPHLVAAPLPVAVFQPEPALLAAGHDKLSVLPALALELRLSLPDYAAPFDAAEIAEAIGSTRPAALVLDPARGSSTDPAHDRDPLTAIAESCGRTRVIYGRGIPGLPPAGRITLAVTNLGTQGFFAGRLFGRRRTSTAIGPLAIEDPIAPLAWLANFGTGYSGGLMVTEGGLMVRQMVVMTLPADAIPLAPEAVIEIGFGDLGKVTLHTRRSPA